jgi:hypothetical protein
LTTRIVAPTDMDDLSTNDLLTVSALMPAPARAAANSLRGSDGYDVRRRENVADGMNRRGERRYGSGRIVASRC